MIAGRNFPGTWRECVSYGPWLVLQCCASGTHAVGVEAKQAACLTPTAWAHCPSMESMIVARMLRRKPADGSVLSE